MAEQPLRLLRREDAAVPTTRAAPGRQLAVALVVMPFASCMAPSIQAGLLQSITRRANHRCDTFYFNVDFARALGSDAYEQLAHLPLPLIGEWLFSIAAFGASAPDLGDTLLQKIDLASIEARIGLTAAQLMDIRHSVAPALVRDLARGHPLTSYDVVGFSSVFQQTLSSIALARELKALAPGVVTIFGGANFQGEMGLELLKTIECIDYVALGESDATFPEFLAHIAAGRQPDGVVGIACRPLANACMDTPPVTTTLDDLPVP
jgi:hypothetical protein